MDTAVSLTSAGFDYKEVMAWPMDTFEMFGKAVERRELERRLNFISDMQAVSAPFGGEDAAKKAKSYLKDLESKLR